VGRHFIATVQFIATRGLLSTIDPKSTRPRPRPESRDADPPRDRGRLAAHSRGDTHPQSHPQTIGAVFDTHIRDLPVIHCVRRFAPRLRAMRGKLRIQKAKREGKIRNRQAVKRSSHFKTLPSLSIRSPSTPRRRAPASAR
jgi:hypothetical protein